VNESTIIPNNTYIEICEMSEEDVAGRSKIRMSALEIVPDNSYYNSNGISWLEEHINENIKSAIGMPYVVSWLDEENQIPSDHGTMSFSEDGYAEFDGVSVGSVQECYIEDVEIDGVTKKLLMTEGFLYSQRYPLFVKWLKEELSTNKVYGSIEINGKGKDKKIGYLNGSVNEDGSMMDGRIPIKFDLTGLAILYLTEPSDKNSVVFEVNSKQNSLDINNKITGKGDTILPDDNNNNIPDNNIPSKTMIELNEMDIKDIATLVENGFNKKFSKENSSDEYCYFYIHKFYPTSSTFVMKSYYKTGEYYKSTYTVEGSKVIIGDIVKAEESWTPVDGGQPVEINNSLINILNNQTKEESKKMDEKIVLELNKKIEDKINEINTLTNSLEQKGVDINSLTKSLEEKATEINTLIEKATELDNKVVELNTTIVEVNKLLESEKAEKESLTVEVNSFREEKFKADSEAKIAEVNSYFETEITKNGFEESEVNSLKSFVEAIDLEGLKKAEAELCAKKFKEMIATQDNTDVETNTKNAMFISIKEKEMKKVPGSIPSFFN